MSWVKVKQGNVELLIPHQAFKDVYEKNGFSIVTEEPKPTHNNPNINEIKSKEVVGDGSKQRNPKGKRPNKEQVQLSE